MTSVPAMRAALKTLLIAAVEPLAYDVQVIRGSPVGVTTLGLNVVLIGRVEGTRSAGSQNRIRTTTRNIPFGTAQDEYTVEIVISVSRPGPGETDDMEDLADEIYEAIRDAVEAAEDPAGVFEVLPTGQFSMEPIADSNGRYVTIGFGIDVTARD